MPKITLTLAFAVFSLCATLTMHTWTNEAHAGTVEILKFATPAFARYSKNPTPSQQQWMRDHYAQMLVFTPYFDTRLSWFPGAWAYTETAGIDVDDPIVSEHPNWVLRDAGGKMLFLPTNCKNGSCALYAADLGNSQYRAHRIAVIAKALEQDYSGIWMDDMVMDWRTSNGFNNHTSFVQPFDPRTGKLMTLANYRRYLAQFTEQLRNTFPQIDIGHNVVWTVDSENNDDPFVIRELEAADYITIERGIHNGVQPGNGRFGLETFLAYVDFLHSLGRKVIFMDFSTTTTKREYGLAGWLLSMRPGDLFSPTKWSSPNDWWKEGYEELDLGSARGKHYPWNNLLRRDFDCGTVLLNQPKSPTRTAALGKTYKSLDGRNISTVRLNAATGIILRTPSCNTPKPPTNNTPKPPPNNTPKPPPTGGTPTFGKIMVVDNGSPDTSRNGTWSRSSSPDSFRGNALISFAGSRHAWWPNITKSGQYNVYAWWPHSSNHSTKVPYRIAHKNGVTKVTVNQRNRSLAGKWNFLGRFDFGANQNYNHVQISSENGPASADAVRFIRRIPKK